jgi:hypothetical protein
VQQQQQVGFGGRGARVRVCVELGELHNERSLKLIGLQLLLQNRERVHLELVDSLSNKLGLVLLKKEGHLLIKQVAVGCVIDCRKLRLEQGKVEHGRKKTATTETLKEALKYLLTSVLLLTSIHDRPLLLGLEHIGRRSICSEDQNPAQSSWASDLIPDNFSPELGVKGRDGCRLGVLPSMGTSVSHRE